LNLVANAIIAGIIKNSAGYKADFKVWELVLFLLARPRLSWIVLAGVAGSGGKRVSVPLDEHNLISPQPGLLSQNSKYQPVYVHEMAYDHMNNSTSTLVKKQYDLPWINAFLSAFIAEVLMQLAALYIMGRTVRFAWKHGYYNVGFDHKLYKYVPNLPFLKHTQLIKPQVCSSRSSSYVRRRIVLLNCGLVVACHNCDLYILPIRIGEGWSSEPYKHNIASSNWSVCIVVYDILG
jgi:hypothetical protein